MLRSFSRSSISYARSVMMLVVMINETSIKATRLLRSSLLWVSDVESSRTHFQVLGLEAYRSSKIALSSAKDSTIFWIIKISLEYARNLAENLRRPFFRDRLKKNFDHLFFWRTLALVPLVLGLGLEHICPWPREGLSSEGLSLALASDFFVLLASKLVSSTPLLVTMTSLEERQNQVYH